MANFHAKLNTSCLSEAIDYEADWYSVHVFVEPSV